MKDLSELMDQPIFFQLVLEARPSSRKLGFLEHKALIIPVWNSLHTTDMKEIFGKLSRKFVKTCT